MDSAWTQATDMSVKIVKSSLTMAVDEEFVDVSVEEIAEGEGGWCGRSLTLRIAGELAALRPSLS